MLGYLPITLMKFLLVALLLVIRQTTAQLPRIQLHYSALPISKPDSEFSKPAHPVPSNLVRPEAYKGESDRRPELSLPSFTLEGRTRLHRSQSSPNEPSKVKGIPIQEATEFPPSPTRPVQTGSLRSPMSSPNEKRPIKRRVSIGHWFNALIRLVVA